MTEIEKVSVDFEARVAEAIAKIEELKAAIRSVGNDRNSVIRITDDGSARRTGENARRDMRRAADDTERDWRQVFRRIMSDNDNAFGRMTRTARRDGERAGRNFGDGFRNGSRRGLGLAPGGQRADWGRLIGMTLPALAPAAAGLAAPLAGAFEVAMPALFSTAAIAPFVVSAFGQVQEAASKLSTQEDKFNAAAGRTAINLKTNAQAAKDYKTLLSGVIGPERDAVAVLSKQGMEWDKLTTRQKIGLVQLREDDAAYKALAPAQKDALNALIAERAAWVALDPAQAKALRNYQKMSDTFGQLKTRLEPTMFKVLADAEQAAVDGMKPLYPVLHQVALGFDDLFVGLDHWFKSADYQRFVAMWSGDARRNIDSVGGAIGRIVLGLIHMYEAMHPLMKPSEDWLDRITKKFAAWPTSPKGMVQFQNFMVDVRTQGPLVWGTLKNIGHGFDIVVAALAGNPLPWQVLKDVSKIMVWIASAPGGRVAINIIAWAIAIDRLAKALKGLVAMEGVLGLISRGGIGAGATAGAARAAGATAGLNVLTASQARALGFTRAGAALPGTGTVGVASGLSLAGPIAAIVGAGALMVGAFNKVATNMRNAADRDAGVITHSSGVVTAATTDHGTKVSYAFRALANSYQKGSTANVATLHKGSEDFRVAMSAYNSVAKKGNDDVKAVMYLGRTQFGQSAGLFVRDFGINVAGMGKSLRSAGKTLNQAMIDTDHAVFKDLIGTTEASWRQWESETKKASGAAFQKQQQNTRADWNALSKAISQYTDDAFHGRTGKEKQDFANWTAAVKKFMDDSNKGLIDKSSKNVAALGRDIAKYLKDMAAGDSSAAAKDMKRLQGDLAGSFSRAADGISAAAQKAINAQTKFIQGEIASINGKADGGYITGPGTGRSDSILTRVSNGEFVVNARSTAQHRSLLEAINHGFRNGGYVGESGEGAMAIGLTGLAGTVKAYRAGEQKLEAAQAAAIAAAAVLGPGAAGAAFNAVAVGVAQRYAKSLLGRYGWGASQFGPLKALWNQESGWNPYAVNPSSGAYGIPQALGHGHPYNLGDYRAQIRWGLGYIDSRYGSPAAAWAHERRFNWYDDGGLLPPGLGGFLNSTRKPEAVLNDAQWRSIHRLAAQSASGVLPPIVITLDGRVVYESMRTRGWQAQQRSGRDLWSLTR